MHLPVTDQISLTEFRPSDKAICVERIGDRDIYDRTLRIPFPYTENEADEWLALVAPAIHPLRPLLARSTLLGGGGSAGG